MSNKALYELAMKELDGGKDEALWIKALVKSDGDEARARLDYVRLRVEELENSQIVKNNVQENENFSQILKKQYIKFYGDYADSAMEKCREIVKANKSKGLVFDVFINSESMLCAPSIDGTINWGNALIVATGPVGILTAGLVGSSANVISNVLNQNKGLKQKVVQNLDKVIVIDLTNCTLRAKEVKTGWDLLGGIWETHIQISGNCALDGGVRPLGMSFSIEGRTTQGTKLRPKNNVLRQICQTLHKEYPSILEDTNASW